MPLITTVKRLKKLQMLNLKIKHIFHTGVMYPEQFSLALDLT